MQSADIRWLSAAAQVKNDKQKGASQLRARGGSERNRDNKPTLKKKVFLIEGLPNNPISRLL